METCIMATMKVRLFLLSSLNETDLLKIFVKANVLQDLQTIRHNEHFPYSFAVSRFYTALGLGNTTAILPNCRKRDHQIFVKP